MLLSLISDLARPKSPTLTAVPPARKQLDGFTSRWMTPMRCLLQSFNYVQDFGDGFFCAKRAFFFHQLLQGGAGHQFHDDVRPAGILVGRETKTQRGLGNQAGEAAFLAKALHGAGRRGKFGEINLMATRRPDDKSSA